LFFLRLILYLRLSGILNSLVQHLIFEGSISWTLIATITIGFFVGLVTSLGCRMPMTRAPRQLLTGWVAHTRPNGCPKTTWVRASKKALKCRGLPVTRLTLRNGVP
jgi:hypothetical protein